MNAFALPGGYVYVFRGLIENVHDESELIGVLGHEWAHVTARHGTKNVSRGIKVMAAALLAKAAAEGIARLNESDEAELIGNTVGTLAMAGGYLTVLNKGRQAELEADRLGSQYAWALGYEPWGIAKMFETFKKQSGSRKYTTLEKLVASHPEHDDRIAQVTGLSTFFYPRKDNYVVTTPSFEDAKAELLSLSPSNFDSEAMGKAFVNGLNSQVQLEIKEYFNQNGYQLPILR